MFVGERSAADVQNLGLSGHDGAASAVCYLSHRRTTSRAALGEYHGVELTHPGPATRNHDVLPRLRSLALHIGITKLIIA